MCSRVLGLAREQIFAALFGGGGAMDAFTVAFRIPNLLRDLFAEGALSTAFVTTFSKTIAREGDAAPPGGSPNKVATLDRAGAGRDLRARHRVLAPAGGGARARLRCREGGATAQLTRIMFPFILLVSLAALVMGDAEREERVRHAGHGLELLQSRLDRRRRRARLALIDPHFGPRALVGLAIGTLIGGALQLAVQLPPLRGLGYRFHPDFRWRDPGVCAILALMGPAVIAASTTQVNVLVNSMFASTLGDGAIFWLAIAFRLMQLPLGLFGVALGTVTLPLLSRLVVAGDMTPFRTELARGMRLMFLLTIPSTIGLMMLAEPIISVLYQHGVRCLPGGAGGRGAAFLCHRARGLRGAQGAGECFLRARPAQDADGRELPRGRPESCSSTGSSPFISAGDIAGSPSRPGCVATCNFLLLYALMQRHLGSLESRRMLAHARQDRRRRERARGCLRRVGPLAAWPTGRRRPFWSKTLAAVGDRVRRRGVPS